jgi:hypothetical protein
LVNELGCELEMTVMTGEYGSIHGVSDVQMKKMKERFQHDVI